LEGISVPRIIDLSISLDGEVHCDPPEKRSKLRQELSCRHEIEGLESFRKAAEDRFQKFQRSVCLASISPKPHEDDTATQLEGQESPRLRYLKRLQQACETLARVLL
jgi:hypothetical protein